ncbi:hypothetical protein EQG49_04975 [Periweissella cryptocerci]|uniref:FUSC family protein n=1 Tax=Periweissella cryptocerci TaxID=2506420 RepID=A0A4P6YT74_9LACO|nr:hypothetical protein [Periweissella cryptocerci]QBO35862.1 hypothetical protein EQG49_04975 [Periweissella cryptocerci]
MNTIRAQFIRSEHNPDPVLRPIGAGLAMLIPLLVGLLTHDMRLAAYGVLGSFSYLAFQHKTLTYNVRAIFLHGVVLLFAYGLGMISSMMPWTIPFFIAIISYLGYIIVKIFQIPKPGHFFVIMLYATGTSTSVPASHMLQALGYMTIGVGASIIIGNLISLIERLPHTYTSADERFRGLHHTDKYYVMLYKRPDILLDAFHFAAILLSSLSQVIFHTYYVALMAIGF